MNHWTGTYKLDVAQSKIGGQAPVEETVAVGAASNDSVKYHPGHRRAGKLLHHEL
jgi:hypothetical protein